MAKRTSRKAPAPRPIRLGSVPTGFILTRSTTVPSGRDRNVQARKANKHRNQEAF